MKAEYVINTLNTFFEEEKVPFHMVNFGTLFRFVIPKEYEVFFYSMITKGIFVWAGRNCFLCTEHTNEEIERIISAVKETIREMKEAGFFPESSTSIIDAGVEDKKGVIGGVITKPASLIQQRLYIELKANDEDPYDIVSAYSTSKNIDEEKLEIVINKIVQRHEILRTSFVEEDGQIVMKIQPSCKIKIRHMESSEEYAKLIQDSLSKFDLSKAPLFEVIKVKHGSEDVLVFHFHHIVADGMSMDVFNQEFISLYNNKKLPELKKQYSGYVEFEKQLMTDEWLEETRNFWVSELQDCVTGLPLPYDRKPEKSTMAGSTYVNYINNDELAKLKMTAKKQGASLFMVLLSVIDIVLHKISGENNFAISTPVTTKFAGGFEENIGMFTNTMALGCHIEPTESFTELLKKVKKTSLASYSRSDYPYNMLVNDLDARDERAINVAFVYENTNGRDPNHGSELELKNIPFIKPVQEDEILFECLEKSGVIEMQVGYQTDLFDENTIVRICGYIHRIIESITENQNIRITDIDILSDEEKHLILNDFNATETEYPRDKTVVELFEEQVKKTPDNIALVFEDEKLTYAELNARANSLAHKLRELGVKPDDFVAIIADKSIEIIEGIYGIIKAGGAYVPIDPTYPEDRIAFMLEDCKPKAVLKFTTESITIDNGISVIDLADGKVWEGASENPEVVNKPEDAIYCIYTSGTTGKPKGSLIEHRSVVRLVKNTNYIELDEHNVILQTGSMSFDASTLEVWGAFLNGGKLVITTKEIITDNIKFRELINKEKVNTMWLTSTLFNQMISEENDIFDGLEHLLIGGEKLSDDHVRIMKNRNNGVKLTNGYGPTENTTFTTTYEIPVGFEMIPIGKPIANTKIYIMNGGNLCGIGVPGELCTTGDGVARGYLNRPELTAEKFVKNPFGEGRMYRTGDLARWLPDGNIEFLGRIDEQVKIHGFRIELGEIESKIREIENIKDCAVIARADASGDKAIYAYYTSDSEVSVSEIRDRLSESLPEYMVPAYMMQIESIPVTRNGKLDRRALPEIETKTTREYVAPRNEAEEAVCKAFSEILGVERVGVQDSFFELGGDSIKAIRIISKLRNAGYTATVKDVMNGKTAEKIALAVKNANEKQKYEQGEVSGRVESTPIIKSFEEWDLAKPEHFNQSMMFPVDGIENDVIHKAIEELVKHHDVLRAVYKNNELEILPIAESELCDFYEFDYSNEVDKHKAVEDKCTEIQGSIDLENGPLVKIAVFELGYTKQMMFCIHHLVVDGVSWRILSEDFDTAVNQIKEGKEVKLPEKTASFIEWSQKLKEYGEKLDSREKEYWKKANTQIAEGKIAGEYVGAEISYTTVEFSEETTEKLLTKSSNAYGAKIDEVLLAGLARAVGRVTGQNSVAIKLEGHGREEIHEPISIDRTVGWFTNVYAISLKCSEDNDEAIINAKDTIRSVPNMGMGYGFVEHNSTPDICFNYLGDFSGSRTSFVSEYNTGDNVAKENSLDSNILIDGQVNEGKLELIILTKYDHNVADKIKFELSKSIEELAKYCSKDEKDKKTISDMELDSLDAEGLSFINSLIG